MTRTTLSTSFSSLCVPVSLCLPADCKSAYIKYVNNLCHPAACWTSPHAHVINTSNALCLKLKRSTELIFSAFSSPHSPYPTTSKKFFCMHPTLLVSTAIHPVTQFRTPEPSLSLSLPLILQLTTRSCCVHLLNVSQYCP